MKNYEVLINLGYHYAESIISGTKRGVGVRNSYIFSSFIKHLATYSIRYKILMLNKPRKMPLWLIPLATTKCCYSLEPLHMFLLSKSHSRIKANGSIIFIHYYFDLVLYNWDRDYLTIVEMPESIIETAGYLARRRYGVSLLRKELASYLRRAFAVTVPTMRDALSYIGLGINSNRIYVIYNVFPHPFTLERVVNMTNRDRRLAVVIDNWGPFEERLRLALKIVRRFPRIERVHLTNAPYSSTMFGGKIVAHEYMPRAKWLELLSTTSIFLFYPKIKWSGGYSVRLNDAALMGNVVFGGEYELRGEPYPHTFTYLDENDLFVKLQCILDKETLHEMGLRNHMEAIRRYRIGVAELERLISNVTKKILGS
ncbi:MAG: hypothetical protein ABWK02_06570 [Aquificaceae bacterium]